jgi:flagellar motor switch/type III secretory pathway protein FliN
VRVGGAALSVRGSSLAVRRIAQRLLGGPDELAAPRPLGVIEKSIWTLVVATALEDLGVAGEVWPQLHAIDANDDATRDDGTRGDATRADRPGRLAKLPATVELAVTLDDLVLAVQLHAPPELLLRVPPERPWPSWFATTHVDVPIVVGRCALDRRSLDRLAVRTVITLERPGGNAVAQSPTATLDLLGGSVGIRAAHGAVVAEVVTGYVPRDMSLPDMAHVELTVALGTTRLSLREISDLAIGHIVQLGRPLAGPFELRAAGRVVGRGELVDVDGELAVRIVSLGE